METAVEHPKWNGDRFADAAAQVIWSHLPAPLQRLASSEFASGNVAQIIIAKEEPRPAVILAFDRGPLAAMNESEVVVHRRFDTGNYCYDGTRCTYEVAGSFLTFEEQTK